MLQPALVVEVAPGDREYEEVGRLADDRQFMLTANLRPSVQGETESRFLVLVIFDRAGVATSVDVRNLGLRSAVDRQTLTNAIELRLAELGSATRCPILIQPIDATMLGHEFGPITVHSDEAPELQLNLGNGAIVPGWPFGTDD